VNKEERTKRFKSMSSVQRQELILMKMKERHRGRKWNSE